MRGIRKKATKRRKKKKKKEDTSTVPWSQGGGQSSFHANNKSCLPYRRCTPVLSRLARMKNRSRPLAENVELQLPSTEAVMRWYRRTLDAPRHKSLIFTRRWRCRGCVYGASRCHGANKYEPIDRLVREKKKKKGASDGPTSVDRPARLTPTVHAGQ